MRGSTRRGEARRGEARQGEAMRDFGNFTLGLASSKREFQILVSPSLSPRSRLASYTENEVASLPRHRSNDQFVNCWQNCNFWEKWVLKVSKIVYKLRFSKNSLLIPFQCLDNLIFKEPGRKGKNSDISVQNSKNRKESSNY